MNEYEIDKLAVRRAFSRAASHYDADAVLQREICSRMLERLAYIKLQPARILDAGSGTGWGARQLQQRYQAAQIVALDIALGMLHEMRNSSENIWARWWHKLLGGRELYALCADVEALPLAPASVDLVWSNLALQWCNDLPQTFVELHRTLKVGGLIMFSTFGPDTLKELRAAFHAADGYNHINRFADMHDVGDMLVAAGFAEPVMDMEYITLTYADVRGAMQDLRDIGAHNVTAGRAPGMMGKAAWGRMVQHYESLRCDGKLPATFEVIYGHAWKPQPKKTQDGRVIVKTDFKL